MPLATSHLMAISVQSFRKDEAVAAIGHGCRPMTVPGTYRGPGDYCVPFDYEKTKNTDNHGTVQPPFRPFPVCESPPYTPPLRYFTFLAETRVSLVRRPTSWSHSQGDKTPLCMLPQQHIHTGSNQHHPHRCKASLSRQTCSI